MFRIHSIVIVPIFLAFLTNVYAQDTDPESIRTGKNFIPTKICSEQEDLDILKLYENLRVTDVCDGMDKAGLHSIGLMDAKIMPLWKDTEKYTHRIVGIAVTARYVPTNKPPAGLMKPEEFDQWEGHFYSTYSSEPFVDLIRQGTVLVIDDADGADVGTIGSNNIMGWVLRGCIGVVTDSSVRDTDEIITEKVPLYAGGRGRGIRPGRNEIESVNRPISCGDVLVCPGDVIVADGDGVIVVPRERAREVAQFSQDILKKDKKGRRALYEKLGLPLDDSVK